MNTINEETRTKDLIAVYLTTIDNPFDPHKEYDDWKRFDHDKGYYTSEYLARICFVSDELSDASYLLELERAIDEICRLNVLGIYRKISVFSS